MIKTIFSILLFISIQFVLQAQDPIYNSPVDSIPASKIKVDTSQSPKAKKSFFKDGYPSPKKAALIAVLPGMGQIYNKKYWKLPIVYGALGGVIYAIDLNTKNYNKAVKSLEVKTEIARLNSMGEEVSLELTQSDPFPNTPETAVTAGRNSADKNRQLSWIGVIAFYLMSAGDAFVDAHLKDFSVDDDISFRPMFETNYVNQATIGVSIRIPLSK